MIALLYAQLLCVHVALVFPRSHPENVYPPVGAVPAVCVSVGVVVVSMVSLNVICMFWLIGTLVAPLVGVVVVMVGGVVSGAVMVVKLHE